MQSRLSANCASLHPAHFAANGRRRFVRCKAPHVNDYASLSGLYGVRDVRQCKPERIEEGAIGLANSSVCKSGNGARNESSGAKCAHMFELNRGLSMNRRKLLKAVTLAAASGAISAPAIAQSTPALRWRLATTFPKSLDTLYGACEMFSRAIAELSDQKFQIGGFGPGEIVLPFQAFDADGINTVDMGNSASYYYIGKDQAFAFGTAVPFGLNTRQMNAWLAYGGGLDLLNELYRPYNDYGIPFGNTTAQMGGWFRKEIKTADDLRGLKFRVGGVAGVGRGPPRRG